MHCSETSRSEEGGGRVIVTLLQKQKRRLDTTPAVHLMFTYQVHLVLSNVY